MIEPYNLEVKQFVIVLHIYIIRCAPYDITSFNHVGLFHKPWNMLIIVCEVPTESHNICVLSIHLDQRLEIRVELYPRPPHKNHCGSPHFSKEAFI